MQKKKFQVWRLSVYLMSKIRDEQNNLQPHCETENVVHLGNKDPGYLNTQSRRPGLKYVIKKSCRIISINLIVAYDFIIF